MKGVNMADKLGPTFGNEVHAAGLGGLPFSWLPSTGEIFGRENLTTEQNTTLDSVVAAHDPTLTAVPSSVSQRQFQQALAEKGFITQQDALDAVRSGKIPPVGQDFIATLPPDQQFPATMMFNNPIVLRYDSLLEQFGIYQGWTARQMDDLFRYAATL